MEIHPVRVKMFHEDRQTDTKKLIVACRNFANEPKNNLPSANTLHLCFCMDLRTNSNQFPIRHQLIDIYNQDGLCLLCGTDWLFK